jgi:SAM-dependent methyltransferase
VAAAADVRIAPRSLFAARVSAGNELLDHGRTANLVNVLEPVIRAFDEVAPVYHTVLPFFARRGAELAAWLPPSTHGVRLLDVGAGIGAVAMPALERGYAVIAIDRSTAMVARLQAEHPAIDARVMDAGGTRRRRARQQRNPRELAKIRVAGGRGCGGDGVGGRCRRVG